MSFYKTTCKFRDKHGDNFYLIYFEDREEYLNDYEEEKELGVFEKGDNEFISITEYLGQSDRYSSLAMDGHDVVSVEIEITETNDLVHTIADCGNYHCKDKYGDKRNWCLKCYSEL